MVHYPAELIPEKFSSLNYDPMPKPDCAVALKFPWVVGIGKFSFRAGPNKVPFCGAPHIMVAYRGGILATLIPLADLKNNGLDKIENIFSFLDNSGLADEKKGLENMQWTYLPRGAFIFVPAGYLAIYTAIKSEHAVGLMVPLFSKALVQMQDAGSSWPLVLEGTLAELNKQVTKSKQPWTTLKSDVETWFQ